MVRRCKWDSRWCLAWPKLWLSGSTSVEAGCRSLTKYWRAVVIPQNPNSHVVWLAIASCTLPLNEVQPIVIVVDSSVYVKSYEMCFRRCKMHECMYYGRLRALSTRFTCIDFAWSLATVLDDSSSSRQRNVQLHPDISFVCCRRIPPLLT